MAPQGRKLHLSPDGFNPKAGTISSQKFDGSPFAAASDKHTYRPSSSQASVGRERAGAPPTEGLFSASSALAAELENSKVSTPLKATPFGVQHAFCETVRTPGISCSDELNTSVFSPRLESRLAQSPAQIDPFFTEGYPPAASSYVLQQFSQYGSIIKYEIHNTGNWMHVKYQTKIQAKKALSKNGKIFARNIMIGVCPCIKKEIASIDTESSFACATPSKVAAMDASSVPCTPLAGNPKPPTMRPLAATPYRPPSAQVDPLSGNKFTPQKKDSMINKAMDYVFGW